jgi:flagellar biosynthetic protein FliQ
MDQSDVYQVLSLMLRTVLVAAAPVMLVALVVGLAISFFQALTQVQEMTLTFVPKIIAIVLALGVSLPFMFSTLRTLSDRIFDLIMTGSV